MAPAERTGATGMRPSFGVVGRAGVMTLVDSLVCPICKYQKPYLGSCNLMLHSGAERSIGILSTHP